MADWRLVGPAPSTQPLFDRRYTMEWRLNFRLRFYWPIVIEGLIVVIFNAAVIARLLSVKPRSVPGRPTSEENFHGIPQEKKKPEKISRTETYKNECRYHAEPPSLKVSAKSFVQ